MNQYYFKTYLVLLVFSLSVIISNGQTWTNFTNTQQINSMVVDRDGSIWCATEGGVAKYDGSAWIKYTTIDGLFANRATAITLDSANHIWVASVNGLSKFNGTRWVNYNLGGSFNINRFPAILGSDKLGNIWYGTYGDGVYKFDGTNWVQYLNTKTINCISSDQSGIVWIGTYEGIYTFDGTTWVQYTTADGLFNNNVVDIGIESNGTKWILYPMGISKYDGSTWTYTAAPISNTLSLKSISIDVAGNKWVAAVNNTNSFRDSPNQEECKVFKFDGSIWADQHYIDKFKYDGLITSIKADKNGNKLCATNKGIQLLNSINQWSSLYTFNNSNGLVNKSVTTIVVEKTGVKWIGTSNGVSRFDGKNWQNYTTSDGLCASVVTSIAIDSSGNKWIGTANGLSKFDGASWTTYNTTNGLPSNIIKSIAVDHNNVVWVGTDNGAAAYDEISWRVYTDANGLSGNTVNSIAIDPQGNKWFGTPFGISKFNNVAWQTISGSASELLVFDSSGNLWFKERYYDWGSYAWKCKVYKFDGTNLTSIYNSEDIRSLAIDKGGKVWVSISSGISIYNGTNWQFISSSDANYYESDNNLKGINGMTISCIAVDKNGDVIIGSSNRGLTVSGNGKWNDYSVEKGLVHNAVSSIAIDKKGNKWIGTADGFSQFDDVNWFTYSSKDYSTLYSYARPAQLIIDRQNTKWVMQQYSSDQYLYKFNDTAIYMTSRSGINYFSFAADTNNYVWILALDWDLRLNAPDRYEFYVYPVNPKYIYIDNKNNKWFGFTNSFALATETLYSSGFGAFTYTQRVDLSANPEVTKVTAAYIDNNGNKWIGTNAGLYYHDGSSLEFYTTSDGLVNNYINSIVSDSHGNLWIGTNGGVSKFNGITWTNYTTADGLADNQVSCIAIDPNENKWFGTVNGLSKFSEPNINPPLGINQPTKRSGSNVSNVNIYPNPSTNYIHFQGVTSGSTLQLLTMDGQLLASVIYTGNPIDISNFENGMYLVKISNSNTTETKKLIKQ